jgi:NADP-dependent 3-hydroxy acid dehydrogenase YdfG
LSKSIAVFGAGPGLGQDVARRREPLELFTPGLTGTGASAHVITADLADTDAVPALVQQIRAMVGGLDAIYYAPTSGVPFSPGQQVCRLHRASR